MDAVELRGIELLQGTTGSSRKNRDDDDHIQFDNDVDRIFHKLSMLPSFARYPDLIKRCRPIVTLWHDKFATENKHLWKKMKGNIPKELNESAFILDEMISVCNELPYGSDPITIIDMCSGIGYLSMFLSHLLPPEKVSRILSIDVLFPAHNASTSIHSTRDGDELLQQNNKVEVTEKSLLPKIHLSIGHLVSEMHPIPIKPRRANIKKGRELRQISKYCVSCAPGQVIILGVHLCKSLSVHTTRLFTMNINATRLYLKPCCLPGRKDLKRRDPPFWEFVGMKGGGFGVKTLYCQEICESKEAAANIEVMDDFVLDPKLDNNESNTENEDGYTINTSNKLFSKWTRLLRDAASSVNGVTTAIKVCSVQTKHF